ncbi:hypothetical protein DSO57_1019775 [Entomophthora muscae]|uniref:Uncharacterized protein n=1 Tax=Entomophthora muscae TaxID=34485 RepID=A0ACC2UCQ4_9FUNG|nr:hypothetical protein DSO57_1019775 [Entomophthora muscae]
MLSSSILSTQIDPEELYVKQEQIGKGTFGKVYLGYDKRTEQPVAIKIIDLELAEEEVEDIELEIRILSQLNSPHVIKYYGSYSKGTELWIIMEYCLGGSCADLLRPGAIPEPYIAIILREILKGLEYLERENKIHRDIKSANILLTASGEVKLADFGFSGQLTATQSKKNSYIGSPFWMAPEVIKQSAYDSKADIWSLGITAIELATQNPPHSELHPLRVLFLIPESKPPQLTGKFSKLFKDFVKCCLNMQSESRPSAKELLKHQFLKRAKKTSYLVDLIERNQNWTEQPGRDVEANPNVEKSLKATVYEPTWDFGSVKQELLRDFESSTDDRSNYKTCTESNSHSSSITPNLLSQCFSERDETPQVKLTVYTGIVQPVLNMFAEESQQEDFIAGLERLKHAFVNLEKDYPKFSQRFLLEAFEELALQEESCES